MSGKILVTGGQGMVGSALQKELVGRDAVFVSSVDYDLRDRNATHRMFLDHKPDWVIHLAAKVGGVKANTDNLGQMYTENLFINTNVLEEARLASVKKLVSVLSTCVYPANASLPLTEEQLHNGLPHDSNQGYAFVKRGLDVQSRMYRIQYGCNFVTAIPPNLFGESDNFDYENSHMLPAVIRKIYEAKLNGDSSITFWGDGKSLREILFVGDFAKILLKMLEFYNDSGPLNVGPSCEYSIREIVEKVCKHFDYCGMVIWDETKMSGQFRKLSSNKKLLSQGWWGKNDYTNIDTSLKMVENWFVKQYPAVRGF